MLSSKKKGCEQLASDCCGVGGHTKALEGGAPHPKPAPRIASISLYLSCVLYNKPVNRSRAFS